MKTNSSFGFSVKMLVLLGLVYLSSCKKEVLQTGEDTSGTVAKVNTWLQSQKQLTNLVATTSVDNLVANLDYSNLHFETLNATEKLIVVPLKGGFVSEVNKGKNPLNLLLLIQNKEGNIRKGNIVQFTKKDGSKTESLPENTFYNFYNKDWLVCDGKFSFLNLNDKILYEMGYTNGKLSSYGKKSSRPADKANTFTSGPSASAMDYTGCIDWYLVTTEYFADGTSISSELFLYQTCDGLEQTMEGGGGAGGGCDMTAQQVLDAISSVSFETTSIPNSQLGSPNGPDANGIIRAPKPSSGGGFTLHILPGYDPHWEASYAGVVYKTSNNAQWKWESFTYNSFPQTEGSFPPCVSATMTASGASTVIASDGLHATGSGNYACIAIWTCITNSTLSSYSGTFSCTFAAN